MAREMVRSRGRALAGVGLIVAAVCVGLSVVASAPGAQVAVTAALITVFVVALLALTLRMGVEVAPSGIRVVRLFTSVHYGWERIEGFTIVRHASRHMGERVAGPVAVLDTGELVPLPRLDGFSLVPGRMNGVEERIQRLEARRRAYLGRS
ncbi:MAG TPA: PH domain-containing protein [Acidimicrobiales bacterium]|nr:PH domain-containing protein [Acidimicrobiales bacterium]